MVPASRSSIAIHRNATTELGRIQASSTSVWASRLAQRGASRIAHASAKPRPFCPITAEPSTKMSVSHSEL